jgi:pimeloyl-ACP methyl ester carboxylesterase
MTTRIRAAHGTTRLAFDSVTGITNTVERMHSAIARGPLPVPRSAETGRAPGLIAAAVYSTIRGVCGALSDAADHSFRLASGFPSAEAGTSPGDRASIPMMAALNGSFGDHLEASGNPLAISMQLMAPEQPLSLDPGAMAAALPDASPHLVVLVHGLCLSEKSWSRKGAPSVGDRLEEIGYSPLYLRYNSGRHISSNGQDFAELLERLCDSWPVPVESISLIGHSMGGLVIRSAGWYGEQAQCNWLRKLRRVVCLGTPHHGSPLERAAHALDVLMQKTRYIEPLTFGRQRSVGIKDLRHGNLLDEDWQGHDPDQPRPDTRRAVPLLPSVDYYFCAASVGKGPQDPIGQLLGDLLVRLDSATGSHAVDLRKLRIKPENCQVIHEKNHFDLLDDERVHRQIVDWFTITDVWKEQQLPAL